jgi:serine/threonine-protein kinase
MDSVRWQQIERLYHAALARPVAERDAFVDARCQGDESLRSEVASLLAREANPDVFLESPAAHLLVDPRTCDSEGTDDAGIHRQNWRRSARLG